MTTFAKSTFSATAYAAFRPRYPPQLYNRVLEFHQGPKKLCLDLGCGPGTVTFELAKHFDNAIGTDPSRPMVETARQNITTQHSNANIVFEQGSGESSPFLEDSSVDLVTAAQASHWFDYARLWPEMKRLVRPGGTLAFWGYVDHIFVGVPKATEILQHYLYDKHPDRLGSYWPGVGRSYLQDYLRIVQPPDTDWEAEERHEYRPDSRGKNMGTGTLLMNATLTVAQCKDYTRTFSPYHTWQERHPEQKARSQGGDGDLADYMFDQITQETGKFGSEQDTIDVEWGSILILTRRRANS